MILNPVTTRSEGNVQQQGLVSGVGQFVLVNGLLGGINISTDGANAAVVTVRRNDATGAIVAQFSTVSTQMIVAPFLAAKTCYFTITGTGASAQFFEWTE